MEGRPRAASQTIALMNLDDILAFQQETMSSRETVSRVETGKQTGEYDVKTSPGGPPSNVIALTSINDNPTSTPAETVDTAEDSLDDSPLELLASVDYNICIKEQSDLVNFASAIRDAIVLQIALSEHFSSVRLRNATLVYDDWLCARLRGLASDSLIETKITVKQTQSALQLAGTVIHELGHILVGPAEKHSVTWIAGVKALGLTHRELAQHYVPEDFSPTIRLAIARAIIQFTKDNPHLVIANAVVRWPDGPVPLPFQIDCVRRMLDDTSHNWLLADEMGLGKTIEALLFVNSITFQGEGVDNRLPKVLVICPNSLRLNWVNECNKWLCEKRDIEMTTTGLYIPSDFIVASYEGVKRWQLALQQVDWDVLIVDESHYCKTPSAQRTRATFSIKAKFKLYMTGTPILNYPYEIFPLLHSLMPEVWREVESFHNHYCHPTQHKYGRNLKELHSRLVSGKWVNRYGDIVHNHDPVMIRRLKKDVLTQLPKKRRQIIEVPCDTPEFKKLIEYEKKLWDSVEGKGVYDEILAAINVTREAGESDEDLAQVIEMIKGSRQFFFSEISRVRHQTGLAKLPLLIEHIQDCLDSFENGEKLVVFTHHNDVSSGLYNHFKRSVNPVLVTGLSTAVHERQAAVDSFQNDPSVKLFIGSMRVAGLGITLTAAHHVIFGELDWTPALLTQCEDRCHRIGQEYPLLVQHFVVQGSMDSFMAKKLVNKQKSIKLALDYKGG